MLLYRCFSYWHLLGVVSLMLVFFAVALWVVHSSVNEGSGSCIIAQVLLIVVNTYMHLRFAVVQVVRIRVVTEATVG